MVQFRSSKCQDFLDHWHALKRDGELMPAQSDLFDHAEPHFAPYLHVAEIGKDNLIFRLMGTALVERWGRDKTGEIVGLDQPDDIRFALFENSRLAYAVPCGFRLVIEFAANNGSELEVEAVVLPLAVEAGRPGRMVSFSQVMQTLKYGTHSERYLRLPTVTWVDVGAGVADQPSLTVNSKS